MQGRQTSERIGVFKFGGIGDACDTYVLTCGIRRKHPDANITVYVNSESGAELLQRPVVDVVRIPHLPWPESVEAEAWKFETFYELRPYVGAIWKGDYYNQTAQIVHLKPHYQAAYHGMLSLETNKLQLLGKDVIQLTADAVDIEAHYDHIKPVWTPPLSSLAPVFSTDFVTIHTGVHQNPQGQNNKLWNLGGLGEIAHRIRALGYPVIQLGIGGEPKIQGASQAFGLGILETATVLENARLHIDLEGGLVRLRRLVTRRPSAVLFGPTPMSLYAFSNNINICANVCHPCLWMDMTWNDRCMMGWNKACMQSITVDDVWQAIERSQVLDERPRKVTDSPHDESTIEFAGRPGDEAPRSRRPDTDALPGTGLDRPGP